MNTFLSSRSRVQTAQRCMRARWWLDEAPSGTNADTGAALTGFEPVRVAIPLATGGSVHKGLESLMEAAVDKGTPWLDVETAVSKARNDFRAKCAGRDLDIDALESQSYVYAEQLALTEAIVRLAGTRVVPKLLQTYEVLEVERMDTATLVEQHDPLYIPTIWKCPVCEYEADRFDFVAWETSGAKCPGCSHVENPARMLEPEPEWRVTWRSIPDALVRSRIDGELYVISWKTCADYDQRKDDDARVDMQGLSEPWAAEQRLAAWARIVQAGVAAVPEWFEEHLRQGGSASIRGVQMVYLVKGQRRKDGSGQYRTASALIGGYQRPDPAGLAAPEFATDLFYSCTDPHPFRYAKGGVCPGGKNHKRGDEWVKFNAWETPGGVKGWLALQERGGVSGTTADSLDALWALPVPHYRTREMIESWLVQTQAGESEVARALIQIRGVMQDGPDVPRITLDRLFRQSTERCGDWFHRKCPVWGICHGPAHVGADPVGSGEYVPKKQYESGTIAEED